MPGRYGTHWSGKPVLTAPFGPPRCSIPVWHERVQWFMHLDVDSHASNHPSAARSAKALVPLLVEMTSAKTAVDVGCGTGAWVAELLAAGLTACGIDGPHIPRESLLIPQGAYRARDLALPIEVDQRFDLVLSLEVAEHLPVQSAAVFIHTLISLGDIIVFSAAIPNQGGPGHINEQWPEYWSELFLKEGYTSHDCLRPLLWNMPQVEWWYAQNIILYTSESGRVRLDVPTRGGPPLPLVHPRLWIGRTHRESLTLSMRELPGVIGRTGVSYMRRQGSLMRSYLPSHDGGD